MAVDLAGFGRPATPSARRRANPLLVDYKTDAVKSEAEAEAKVERYALQAAAYAGAKDRVRRLVTGES